MLVRLLFLVIGFSGMIPLLYMIKTSGSIDSSHYQYAAVGLFAGVAGFCFGLYGLIIGGVTGLLLFKIKEDMVCDCVEFVIDKIKPIIRRF